MEGWRRLNGFRLRSGMDKEKRKYARLDLALELSFERQGPGAVLRGKGTTKNLSAQGLCFSAPVPLGVGERVKVNLLLPEGREISFDSRVKWVKAVNSTVHEIGVEISEISLEDQNRYLLFICDLMYDRLKSLRLF